MKILNLIFFASLCTFNSVQAQQTQPVKKTPSAKSSSQKESEQQLDQLTQDIGKALMDELYARVKKEVAQGKDILKKDDSQKLIEYYNTNGDIRTKREKLYAEKYTRPVVFKSLPGESDRLSLLGGIPAPKDPPAALQADPKEHEHYHDKIERASKQAGEAARQVFNKTELAQTYEKGGEEAVKKMYAKKADQSEIIRDMGGAEALQNMSEKERAEAAKKMIADRTGGLTAEDIKKMTPEQKKALVYQMAASRPPAAGNEVSTAFTKELMVNESYRKRYEKMNDADKQAEYRKFEERYTGGAPATPTQQNLPREISENEQEAREIFAINKVAEDFRQELKDLFEPIDRMSVRYEEQADANMDKLMRWSAAEVEKLPTVSDSEYGPRKDGIEFVHYTEAVMAYTIGKDKIAKQRELWDKYLLAYVTAFKKLDDMTARYAARKNPSDRYLMALAELKAAGYGSIEEMNKKARAITNNAASIQLDYNCKVFSDCSDPRQGKY